MASLPVVVARPLGRLRDHLRVRWPVVLLGMALGLVARCASPAPPQRSVEAIAEMLGHASSTAVAPSEFVWEDRGGFWRDAFFGRWVLFLGKGQSGARDVYRARVRLTRGGRPIEVVALRDLSGTPIGDDADLIAHGKYAAFSTSAFGAVQGVTLLDLVGEPGAGVGAGLVRWLETGRWRGVRRVEIAFGRPPPAARFELSGADLVLALGAEATPAAVGLDSGALNTGAGNEYEARATHIPTRAIGASEAAAKVAHVAFGPRGEAAVGGALARMSRLGARVAHALARPSRIPSSSAPVTPPADGEVWPPPPLAVTVAPSQEGEGAWSAVPAAYLSRPRGMVGEPAPQLLRAAVRADAKTVVHLVAIDTRQLELRLAPGWDSPRPLAGPRGDGRIPVGLRARTVAAFNGVGPLADRRLGVVADRRVLAPPEPAVPSIVSFEDGAPAVGPWIGEGPLAGAVAVRQAPTLLSPSAASAAWRAPPLDALVERSALCLTRHGQLVYAWVRRGTAGALARALETAACEASAALATAPARAGFALLHLEEGSQTVEALAPGMSLLPGDVATASPEEFFYLVVREAVPPGAGFEPDEGTQPRPAWLPAIHDTTASHLGAQVRVHSFAAGRFEARLRTGTKELRHRSGGTFVAELQEEQQRRALVAMGVGAGRKRHARGLATDGSVGLPFRADAGALVVDGSRVTIVRSEDVVVPKGGDATELPLTAEDGKLRPEGREVGSMRPRAAACLRDDGSLLVASTHFDSDEATTEALLALGCRRVVALDRGSHHPAFVHRAGTTSPPQTRYESSTLFLLDIEMPGRGKRLDAPPP